MDNINVIKNFLSKEECLELISEAENANDWRDLGTGFNVPMYKLKNHSLLIDINKRVSSLFDKKYYTQLIQMIHKTDSESFWEEHNDNGMGNVVYGVIIYLNENFEGGMLEYPDLNYSIKPETGMLVSHPGNYQHLVTKVNAGNRYTLTSFIKDLNGSKN